VTTPYHILDHLRQGTPLCPEDVRRAALGAADGSWSDAQLGAFLMGVTLRGLDAGSTGALTRAMLESGEQWDLGREVPGLTDSTRPAASATRCRCCWRRCSPPAACRW
jgi:thymidine phosphorylase